eukprot:2215699-Amphidinium_carterae.1
MVAGACSVLETSAMMYGSMRLLGRLRFSQFRFAHVLLSSVVGDRLCIPSSWMLMSGTEATSGSVHALAGA